MNETEPVTLLTRVMSAVADLIDTDPEKGVKAWGVLEKTLGARERFEWDKRRDSAKLSLSERKLSLDEARFEWAKAEAARKAAPVETAPEKPARRVRSVVR